jgi:putative membrane protein
MSAASSGHEDWRALSPRTLWLEALRTGPRSFQLLPVVLPIGLYVSWGYVALAFLAALLLAFGYSWLAWRSFRWRVADNAITIQSGIFERQHRTIPFDRIHDISVDQGPVSRVLEIARVGLETGAAADSRAGDANLDSVSVSDAEDLRLRLRLWRQNALVPETGDGARDDICVFRLSTRDLLLSGLFNFSLIALGLAYVAVQWLDDVLPLDLSNPETITDLAIQTGLEPLVSANAWLVAFSLMAALLLVGFATGIIRTVLTNWDFRLGLGPRSLRRVRGLVTRTDMAVPLARIQSAIVITGPVRSIWGWHELRVRSLASESTNALDHQLVPFAELSAIDAVLQPLAVTRPDAALEWQIPDLRVQAMPGALVGLLIGMAGLWLALLDRWEGPTLLIVCGLSLIYTAIVTGCHRWAVSGTTLYIQRGWWQRRLTILPFEKVQSADIAQGPILRSLACVRLALGVPGVTLAGSSSIDALPPATAVELRRRVLNVKCRNRQDPRH